MAVGDVLPRDEDLVIPVNEDVLPSDESLVQPSTGSIIDASTIGQFNAPLSGAPQSDVDLINQQLNPLGGEAPAIINATNELFVPTLNQPILKGTSSSQTLGSQPIFVAGGGNIPFAAFERQKQARQAQELKKASQFKLRKPPASKDPRLNKNLSDTFNDFTDIFMKRAEEQFGSKKAGIAALTNPATKIGREFIQQMDNLDILASQADQIVDEVAKIDAAVEKGDQFISKETEELSNKLKGNLAAGDVFDLTSRREVVDQLATSSTLDQFFKENDILENIEGEITKRTGISDFGDFKLLSTREKKEYEDGARAQANAIKENVAFRNRELSEEDIFKRIMALKGRTDKVTKSLKTKPKTKGFASKKDVPISEQPKVINIQGAGFRTEKSVPYSLDVQQKPVKIDGLITISGKGDLISKKGITSFIPVENDIIILPDGTKRNVVRGKEIVNVTDLTNEEKAELGLTPLSTQKTVERDVTVDFNNIKAALKGSSKSANASAEAFEDVSKDNKRNSIVIDEGNYDKEFLKHYLASGAETPEDFIKSATESGIDIVFTKEARVSADALNDPLNK